MSYPIGTTLRKKEPFTDDSGYAHLNFVRVVAPSPLKGANVGEWHGANGEAVVVTPAEGFGPNEVLPVAIGNTEYEVEFMPEEPAMEVERQLPQRRMREPSPEEQFERDRLKARAAAEAEVEAVVVKKKPERQ